MKKTDISRLRYWRPINLKIGYALSLALIILAFSWTTERPVYEDPYEEIIETELEVIPPTTHPKKEMPPPPPPPKKVNFEININPEPIEPYNPDIFEPIEPEPIVAIGIAKAPAKPAPPILKKRIEKEDEIPFVIVEEMPRFKGCEEQGLNKKERAKCAEGKLLEHLASNLRYPAIARENGVQGTVVISFIIEKDGSISKPKIVRDIGAGCGRGALRVVENMPDWLPGKQRGREVRVKYNLPVRFRLN